MATKRFTIGSTVFNAEAEPAAKETAPKTKKPKASKAKAPKVDAPVVDEVVEAPSQAQEEASGDEG